MSKLLSTSIIFYFIIFLSSCKKEYPVIMHGDDLIVEQIMNSTSKEPIQAQDIPDQVQAKLESLYFETFFEAAFLDETLGYELLLGNEDFLYFDLKGKQLHCWQGETKNCSDNSAPVLPIDLSSKIKEYVQANYPSEEIMHAKYLQGGFLIKVSNNKLILFDKNKDHVISSDGVFNCRTFGEVTIFN